jgi:glycosyltransferase involved in cell wall biosynthesis
MKLLHVTPGIGADQGGVATAIAGLCNALATADARCEVATLRSEAGDVAGFADFTVHRFERTGRMAAASRPMRAWLQRHIRDYDAVVAHSIWLEPLHYALRAAHDAGVPALAMAHGMLDPHSLAWHRLRKWVRWRTATAAALKHATLVFTCEQERERAGQHNPEAMKQSLVLPLPVPMAQSPQVPREDFVLLMSRVHPRKALLEAVQALVLLRQRGLNLRAVHAGHTEEAEYASEVRRLAETSLDPGAFTMKGPLPGPELASLLQRCRLLWVPTNQPENFGMSIMEGMAAGAPVLASRTALLVPELESAGAVAGTDPDPASMAEQLQALWQSEPHRKALSQAGPAYVLQHYAPQVVGAAWLDALRTLRGP